MGCSKSFGNDSIKHALLHHKDIEHDHHEEKRRGAKTRSNTATASWSKKRTHFIRGPPRF